MIDVVGYLQKIFRLGFKSSAMSSLLWLNLIVTIPCLAASFTIPTDFRWAPFSLALVVVIYTLVQYNALRKTDPTLLQSETFRIEMQKLDIISQKGGPIIFDPVDLVFSNDPKLLDSPHEHPVKEGEVEQ